MTSARIQPFCRKYNINIGCFDGMRINPRKLTQRNISLFIYNDHFCSIRKSNGIGFNQGIEDESKPNFKVVDNVVSDKLIKNFLRYYYKPKKIQSPLTNIIAYDLETFNKIKAVPYCSCLYKLSKTSGEQHRNTIEQEYQKCPNDCVAFKGSDCNNDMLDLVLSFEGAIKKVKNGIVGYNLHLIAHNGNGFDSNVVLNNLSQWRSVVKLIKNGAGKISLKIFTGYVDEKKKIPEDVHFRCGRVQINKIFKKIRQSYELQSCLLKQELEQDEIYDETWKAREHEWLPYVKNDLLSTAFCYARYTIGMGKLTVYGLKNSLILPSLAIKYFNSLRDENDEPIYTYTDAIMRKFVKNAIEVSRCNALIQHYASKNSDEVFNMFSKELNVNCNICDLLQKYFKFLNKHEKQNANEIDSKNDYYRDIDQKEKPVFLKSY